MAVTSSKLMTKEDAIKFIDSIYADEEVIVWQTMSKSDVESALDDIDISNDMWEAFVSYTNDNSGLADCLSNEVVEWFVEFDTVIYPQLED